MKEPLSAIILVHGIGDQLQRSTLNSFSRLFRRSATSQDYSQTVRTLHPNSEHEFAYYSERAEINRTPVLVAEMFWSDLSTIASGFLANLRNFWRLAADAPDIIYASLGPVALILLVGGVIIQNAHGGFKVVSDIVNYFKTAAAHTRSNPIAGLALAHAYDPRSDSS